MPQWLAHIVKYFHNDICLNSRVEEILIERKMCRGVRFEQGGTSHTVSSKYVIAACDVEMLYEKMLPESAVPASLKRNLRKADLYSSSVTVSIALNCPTEHLGFNEELIHLANENLPFDAHMSGDPTKTEISILAPSLRDKSLAPEGHGTLTLYMPAFMEYRNNWDTRPDGKGNYIRGEDYVKLKNEVGEQLIRRVEATLGIDLHSHILFYEVATPVTHWRYTGNKNGTMMGAKPGRENMQRKIAHYRTPVKNLLLGGHWAELGGGVPIAVKAGSNAALIILRKESPKAFRLLSRYMDDRLGLEQLLDNPGFRPYDNSWKQPLTPAEKINKSGLENRE
jgi:prolycopene isomerase